ncbi:unnamed protein product [Pseudo-nitzschia multistriata]|uniref:Chloride channel protein n=1 Tax=Pseudo-nitzschia multistriata TaxID=183589 RepID=A0A448ZQV6_9STRA|nr:unnamed protein product [Pseudo-nitzschia multistriata]
MNNKEDNEIETIEVVSSSAQSDNRLETAAATVGFDDSFASKEKDIAKSETGTTTVNSTSEIKRARFDEGRNELFESEDTKCKGEDEDDDTNEAYDEQDDNGDNFTEIPAPCASAFMDWYINSKPPHLDDPLPDCNDPDDIESSGGMIQQSVYNSGGAAPESVAAIRTFVGPFNDSLAVKFRRRRDRHSEMWRGHVKSYGSTSYKKLDSPVYQHYSYQLANRYKEERQQHEEHLEEMRRRSTIVLPAPPQKKRIFAGLARWLVACPSARSKTKNNPIGTYQQEVRYWTRLILILLGLIISAVIFIIKKLSDFLLETKLKLVTDPVLFGNTTAHDESLLTTVANAGKKPLPVMGYFGWKAFASFLGFNLFFVTIAFMPVTYRPLSGGSGIAEAKATLNGIILPTCTDLLTALCKAVSVICAGAASLPIGLEGPLIFIGLAIGHNAERFVPESYPVLKLDNWKRDFAAVGCACGVAGAFLTPIGGVLFAMEEGASFWSPLLAWRSFAAACVTTIALYLYIWVWDICEDEYDGVHYDSFFDIHTLAIYSGLEGQRQLPPNGVATTSQEVVGNQLYFRSVPAFRVWDFFFFAIIGIVGGIVGALWIEGNYNIAQWRRKLGWGRKGKFLEIMGLTILASCVFWFLPLLYTKCNAASQTDVEDRAILRQLNCPDGYYNQLGTLLLNGPGPVGLNLLYWEPAHNWDPVVLILAGFSYHVVLLLLFGSSISMGVFIPFLYIGACYGRAFAIWGLADVGIDNVERDPIVSTYTMVCSVAMLAGVARVLISITVIMVCSVGTTYMITPFMVASLFAKVVGKAFLGRPGVYDVILEMKGIPFLEAECPNSMIMRGLCAQDIMSRAPLITLEPEQPVGQLLEYLEKYPYVVDYPVVDPNSNGVFLGIIQRCDLLALLTKRRLFYDKSKGSTGHRRAVTFETLVREKVKRVPVDLDDVKAIVTPGDRARKFLNVTPYLAIGHYTVNRFVTVHRAFELFRSLGLRILVVTDAFGRPMGVITRFDLKLLEEVGIDEAYYKSRHDSMEGSYSYLD